MKEGRQFDWGAVVPYLVHEMKVATVEALLWIDKPLSVADFARLFDEKFNKPLITRHLEKLVEADALVVTREQRTRGLAEKLYFFPPE